MIGMEQMLEEVKGDLYLRHRWQSVITKGGYLIIKIPYELEQTFEVECMLQMALEDLSFKLDVYFDYEFYENKIKVFALL